MTNQEINERVAKLCEWYREVDANNLVTWCKYGKCRTSPPDYTKSLDACREFEGLIESSSEQEIRDYIINLEDASNARGSGWDWRSFRLARATPLQRCEAFLRMKWQWDENRND